MELPAKKSLGQHFLTSQSALAKIIEAAHLEKGERVLEIGPGTGILTRALLDAGAKVLAVEKDDRALAILKEKFAEDIKKEQLFLIHDDILERRAKEAEEKSSGAGTVGQRKPEDFSSAFYAVVANIPYYITGAILESFLEHEPRPTRMILLVQKEVSDRVVARDGKESILSISVKAFGTPKVAAKVPRGAFSPPPKVDSAILSIEDISDTRFKQNKLEIQGFFEILKAGFAHRRKLLKNNIKEALKVPPESIDAAWKKLGLDEKVRAEDLTLENWFGISSAILR